MNGILIVDKPSGVTSHDVVNKIRRIFGTKRVGHTGTLDPLATGVLVICLGHATRIAEYLSAADKEYVAEVTFGLTTSTQDTTGETVCEKDTAHLTCEMVESALVHFRGDILQLPPMVSAKKRDGKKLYELARKGIEVERAEVPIKIHELELIDFTPGNSATAQLRVVCSSGTYIRTLANDIGDMLGTGAAMSALRRTRVGSYLVAQSYQLDELEMLRTVGNLDSTVTPIALALPDWPLLKLSTAEIELIYNGQPVPFAAPLPAGQILILSDAGDALGIGIGDECRLLPKKIFQDTNLLRKIPEGSPA